MPKERAPAPSKQEQRAAMDRLVKEAMDGGKVTVTQGKTRIDTTCAKCGAPNRVMATPGQSRAPFNCKECGHDQVTM
jgi:hypothetical protein